MLSDKISSADQARIRQFVEVFFPRCNSIVLAVPKPMQDGPRDREGYTPWKPVDSPIGDHEMQALEEEYGVSFPPLFRAYLMYQCLLMTYFFVRLPQTPFDDPLEEVRQYLELWVTDPYFKQNNLVPFASDGNDAGPVCFDLSRQADNGDCPVVVVDHHRMRHDSYIGETIAASFADLLDAIERELISYDLPE